MFSLLRNKKKNFLQNFRNFIFSNNFDTSMHIFA